MSTVTRVRVLASALVGLVLGLLVLTNPVAAQAESQQGLPADPAAHGYIGLCNEDGQNVTGGSIDTHPFIWKAVSSSRPPSSYQGHGQNADLVMYQPRPDTGPAYWSGATMTAAAYYTSAEAPAVQATYADLSLRDMISQYPPQVDGLYVLRMHYGKADYGLYNTTYPIAVIQVTGKTWRLVQGGTVDCAAAKATSNEQLTRVVGKKQFTAHSPSRSQKTVSSHRARVITAPASTLKGGRASTVASGASSQTSSSGSSSAAGTPSTDGTQAADRAGTSGTSWVLWLLVGIVIVLAAALVFVFRTRRSPSPGTEV